MIFFFMMTVETVNSIKHQRRKTFLKLTDPAAASNRPRTAQTSTEGEGVGGTQGGLRP